MKFARNIIPLILIFVFSACGGGGGDTSSPTVNSITLSKSLVNVASVWGNSPTFSELEFRIEAQGVSWEISSDQDWLSVNETEGVGNRSVSLVISNWDLVSVGQNTATISVKNLSNSEIKTLQLNLVAEEPSLILSVGSLSFSGTLGFISQKYFIVETNSESNLSFEVEPEEGLVVDKVLVNANERINVQLSDTLEAGQYEKTVSVKTLIGTTEISQTLDVNIIAEPHNIFVDRPGIALSRVGSYSKLQSDVELYDSYDQITGNVIVSSEQSWIEVSYSNTKINISIDDSSLESGLYLGTVFVSNDAPGVKDEIGINVGFYKQFEDPAELEIQQITGGRMVSSPLMPYIYLFSNQGTLDTYHVYTGEQVSSIALPNNESLVSLTVSHDGQFIYIGTGSNNLYSLDVLDEQAGWSEPKVFETGNWPLYARPDGLPILIAHATFNTSVFNLESNVSMEVQGGLASSYDPGFALSKNQKNMFDLDYGISGLINLTGYNLAAKATSNLLQVDSIKSLRNAEFLSSSRGLVLSPDGAHIYTLATKAYKFSVNSSTFTYVNDFCPYSDNLKADSKGFIYCSYGGSRNNENDLAKILVTNAAGEVAKEIVYEPKHTLSRSRQSFILSGDEKRMISLFEGPSTYGFYIKSL